MYKFPSFEESKQSAIDYATASIEFTFDYSGWEDESKTERKKSRIFTGRFGQEWLYHYLILNNIPCSKDETSPENNDDFDLKISKYIVDVKTSIHPGFVGQVSPGCMDNNVDMFCFLLTNKNADFIEPIGFISKKKFTEHAFYIGYNEPIRNTNILNKFREGSYFIDADYLSDFFEVIGWFINHA